MSVSAVLLRKLHRIHQQLADLNGRLQRGPRQVSVRESNVAQLEAALAAAQQSVQQTKMNCDKKQLDLKSGENRIDDLKVKLNQASSNKEFHALQEQIAAAEMANSVLADEILEGLEKADLLESQADEIVARVAASKDELKRFREQVAAESEVVRGDVTRLEGELTSAEKELPVAFRDDYQRVVRAKGADAMAVTEDGVCLGCGQQITLNMQNQLLLSEPIMCKSCGRILYMPEPEA
ncbi:MAG: hypothetical protein KDA61_04235 [Planctomycetales bacterium]|nr:hypothetical protein [Planctomycetales bacterium]